MKNIKSFLQQYQILGKNLIWRIFQKLSKVIIDFMLLFISSLLLGDVLFGTYEYLLILMGFFVIIGEFGLSASVGKYIAENSIKSKEKVDSVIASSIFMFFIYCFIVFIVFLTSNILFFNLNITYFLYLIMLLLLISATNLFDGIFIGTKQFKKSSIVTLIPGVFILPLSYVLISNYSINGALLTHIIYYFLLIILMIKFTHIKNMHYDKEFISKILRYSLIIGFAGIGSFLYTNIDAIILQQYEFTVEVGYFQIAFYVFNLFILPCSLFGQVISPYIAQKGIKREYSKINSYLKKIWIIDILGILIALGGFFVGPIFFKIFFPDYATNSLFSIWNLLLILIPFKFHNAILIHGFIYPLGQGKITMILTVIGGVLNVLLDYIFIDFMGFIGVIYSTVIIHVIVVILTSVFFYLKRKKKNYKN
ncbi:MAG: oligosaccharide flippase family protein [Candidatus Lokiarchaeota archaeon]|nr:oligosaccharide flippase family protein [Candidatus Lokiarchaeota archaeon]